jgi:hypothetical protein
LAFSLSSLAFSPCLKSDVKGENMKPSLLRDFLFGLAAFLLLAGIMLIGGDIPQFVYVMF